MLNTRVLLAASAVVLAAASATASLVAQGGQPQAPPPRVFLLALDTDHDGQLSAAEIAAASKSLLTLDKNHDGQLTSDEYSPRFNPNSTAADEVLQRMMLLDRNGDGVLTLDEVPERMQAVFQRGDTNHDGKLSSDEIRAMAQAQADPQGKAVGRGNAPVQLRTDPITDVLDADHDGIFSAEEIANATVVLKTLDKDGDGTLSVVELRVRPQTPEERAAHSFVEWDPNKHGYLVKSDLPDRMQPSFEAIDTDHDGKITPAELAAYLATQPMGRPGGGPPAGGPGNNTSPARP